MALASSSILARVIGHRATIHKLLSLLQSGRVPSSLLFVGAPHQGKKLVALGFAQALLCEKPQDHSACGECSSCRRVAKNQSEGVIWIEPEKGTIKIESARMVVQQLSLAAWGRARVVVIDEAHLLNPQAANALLKSVEEPPPHTHFILLSSSQENILKTLRSRSQVVRFKTLSEVERKTFEGESLCAPERKDQLLSLWREITIGMDQEFALNRLREEIDDREQGLLALRLWHESVRDEWLNPDGGAPKARLALLSERILAAERDLVGHCDVQLTFEDFVRSLPQERGVGPA